MADRRVTRADHQRIADQIVKEWSDRRSRRGQIERSWDDVDRQVSLTPAPTNLDRNGRVLPGTEWMPWFEEAWQATAVEVIASDVMEIILPENGKFFASLPDQSHEILNAVRQEIDDDYGLDPNDAVTGENLAGLIDAVMMHFLRMYDFRGTLRKIVVDAIKYGAFAGRVRIVNSEGFAGDYRGTFAKRVRFPALIHYPIRNVYLDDSSPATWTTGEEVAPAHIWVSARKVSDLKRLQPSDGWITAKIAEFCEGADDTDAVTLIEFEGDLVLPRSRVPSMFLPNVVATVATLGGASGASTLVRYQESPYPFRTWLSGVYFPDASPLRDRPSPYGTAPLLRGRPLQRAGSHFFSLMAQVALFNARPPISYGPDHPAFAITGGPLVHPGALWPDADGSIKVHEIGDMAAMTAVWTQIRQEFMEVSGVLPGRISGETKSHQTTGAVQTEQHRSAARTIGFARNLMDGFLRTFLGIQYVMARECLGGLGCMVWVPQLQDHIRVNRRMLPEMVAFDVFGSGQPEQDIVREQRKLNALTMIAKSDQLAREAGGQPLNWDVFRTEVLRDAGFKEPERFFAGGEGPAVPAPPGPVVPTTAPAVVGPANPPLLPGA